MTRAILLRSAAFAFVWWVLAEGRPDAWLLGLVAVAAGTALSIWLLPPRAGLISLIGLFGFIGFFLWQSVKGGAQVAAMALRPRQDLSPVLCDMPLSLPAGAPRVLMTAAIGLMPGTVGVRVEGERLRLHVLDESLFVPAEAEALQSRIARIFGDAA